MSNSSPNATRDLSALRIDRSAEPPRRAPIAWIVAGVLAAALAVVAIVVVVRRTTLLSPSVETAPVIVQKPTGGADTVLVATGYVVARTKAAVSAKMAGRLEELRVEEGSRVQQGDVIARLENDALRAEVDAATASLAQSRAALERARADERIASIEDKRQRDLLAAQLGTRSAADSAAATLSARRAAVAEAASFVRSSEARLTQAQVGLENANVRAPFSGVVLRKEAEVGEYVAPSVASGSLTRGAIVTMADLASLEVEADVAEGNVARLVDAMPAEVSLDAVPDRRYRGTLRQVMPTADRQKATVQVKVALVDPDDRVKPEMSAKVTFLTKEPDAAALQAPPEVLAPAAAIRTDGGAALAWRVVDGRARRIAVTVGERRGDRVVVASGLSGGEVVIVNPEDSLRDGAVVKVKGE